MKVKDAIEQLQQMDQELEIYDHIYDGTYSPSSKFTIVNLKKTHYLMGADFTIEDDGMPGVILGE